VIARHRTAIQRTDLSRPIRLALDDNIIGPTISVFDYGCGHGGDIRRLNNLGIACQGWDPIYRPDAERVPANVVNLGYVINVIENPDERAATLRAAWSLTEKVLIVSARHRHESTIERHAPFEDGCLTRRQTFQKYYDQHELRDWLDQILTVSSVAAAPGIFYVFRDPEARQSFVAARFRRPVSARSPRYSQEVLEQQRVLLEPLMHFVITRGRLPNESELGVLPEIREEFGGLNRAFALIRRSIGIGQWQRIQEERAQDLLVYLALARFGGRPRFSELPHDLQCDIKAFHSSYGRACELADKLLFSAGNRDIVDQTARTTSVGKLTSTALYIHISALSHLPSLLRVYEGCARALVGTVEGANIIKLHRDGPCVSYLSYPQFEKDPHPALYASLLIEFQTLRVKYREYAESGNPPILHRKEEFISSDHPLRPKFARLTKQEERHRLYEEAHLIGTREGWNKALKERGVKLIGHRVVRSLAEPDRHGTV